MFYEFVLWFVLSAMVAGLPLVRIPLASARISTEHQQQHFRAAVLRVVGSVNAAESAADVDDIDVELGTRKGVRNRSIRILYVGRSTTSTATAAAAATRMLLSCSFVARANDLLLQAISFNLCCVSRCLINGADGTTQICYECGSWFVELFVRFTFRTETH